MPTYKRVMPTYKVEVGPHYTPGFDVYTAEAEALSYWKCATSEAQLVSYGDS